MDDTNPTKEDVEYVDAIKEDIAWLGFSWGDRFYFASQYFDKMYEFAIELIKKGLAYVCELSPEEMREIVAIYPTLQKALIVTDLLKKALTSLSV